MNPLPTPDQINGGFTPRAKARRRAELLALEHAQAADAAAREASSSAAYPPDQVAAAHRNASEAFASVAIMLKPNGERG